MGIFYIITTSKSGDSTSFLYHRKIPLQKSYTVPTSLFLIYTPFLHQNRRNLHHFYIIPAYNVPLNADTRLAANGQDIGCKSNPWTPCLILSVKVRKLYHLYTISTSYPYRFSVFYIISISLKISIVADTISYLYHFSDFYTVSISKRTNVISILYHWGLAGELSWQSSKALKEIKKTEIPNSESLSF